MKDDEAFVGASLGSHVHAYSPSAKWLLLVLAAGGRRQRYNEPIAGRTKLMKELFLLTRATGLKDPYEFEASHYGPSSKKVLRDLNALQAIGAIAHEPATFGGTYSLTPKGLEMAQECRQRCSDEEVARVAAIKTAYNLMPLNQLLAYVYNQFPSFARESVIRDKVLKNPDEAL